MTRSAVRPDPNAPTVELSIVVPFYNEEEVLDALVDRVTEVMDSTPSWELLLVDDGSVDRTAERIAARAALDARIHPVYLAGNYGQTAAMQAGFDEAHGEILVSMDGDLQNDPEDIPRLVEKLREGYDLVTGYRERRQDKVLTRKIPSWIANRLIRWVTGVRIRDTGCSLKAYRRELVDRLHLYSDMHRFIPAMAVANASARTVEIPVRHHARLHGSSKYGLSRVWKVLLDLIVIKTIRTGREGPLALFGPLALACFAVSLALGTLSLILTLSPAGGDVVLPTLTVLFFVLAVYLWMLGLLAETAFHHDRQLHRAATPIVAEHGRPRSDRKSS